MIEPCLYAFNLPFQGGVFCCFLYPKALPLGLNNLSFQDGRTDCRMQACPVPLAFGIGTFSVKG